jgi:hypothetical protein
MASWAAMNAPNALSARATAAGSASPPSNSGGQRRVQGAPGVLPHRAERPAGSQQVHFVFLDAGLDRRLPLGSQPPRLAELG